MGAEKIEVDPGIERDLEGNGRKEKYIYIYIFFQALSGNTNRTWTTTS